MDSSYTGQFSIQLPWQSLNPSMDIKGRISFRWCTNPRLSLTFKQRDVWGIRVIIQRVPLVLDNKVNRSTYNVCVLLIHRQAVYQVTPLERGGETRGKDWKFIIRNYSQRELKGCNYTLGSKLSCRLCLSQKSVLLSSHILPLIASYDFLSLW